MTIKTKFSIGDHVSARDRTAGYREWAIGYVTEIEVSVTKNGQFVKYMLSFDEPKYNGSWNPWFAEDELEEVGK